MSEDSLVPTARFDSGKPTLPGKLARVDELLQRLGLVERGTEDPRQVALGQHADEPPAVEHREMADPLLRHDARRLPQRRPRLDGDEIADHDLPYSGLVELGS